MDIKVKKEFVGQRRICPGFGIMTIGAYMPGNIVDAFKEANVDIADADAKDEAAEVVPALEDAAAEAVAEAGDSEKKKKGKG
jgi:hypothetical protein